MNQEEFYLRRRRVWWQPRFRVPRTLKKAWRKEVIKELRRAFPEHCRRMKLHWSLKHGWTVTHRPLVRK